MAGKKGQDFTNKAQEQIAQATQEAPATQEKPKAQGKRKPRKTYNEQEAEEYMQNMETTGRKGLKLPRINLAFNPAIYDYVDVMARAAGMNKTKFINAVLEKHMNEHKAVYKKVQHDREDII